MKAREVNGDSSESAHLLQPELVEQQQDAETLARLNAPEPFGEGETFDGVLVPYNVLLIIASHLSDDWKAMLAFFHVTRKIKSKLFNHYDQLVAPHHGGNESVPISVNLRYANDEVISLPFRDISYVLQCYQHLSPTINRLTARVGELAETENNYDQTCTTIGCITGVAAWVAFGAAYGVGAAFCLGSCTKGATIPFWGRLLIGEGTSCVVLTGVQAKLPELMTCGNCGNCNCCRPVFSNLIMRPRIDAINDLEQVRFLHNSLTNLRVVGNHASLFAFNRAIRAMRAGQMRMDDDAPDVSFLKHNRHL